MGSGGRIFLFRKVKYEVLSICCIFHMSKRIYTFSAVKGLTRIHEKNIFRANSVFRLGIAKQTHFKGLFGKIFFLVPR